MKNKIFQKLDAIQSLKPTAKYAFINDDLTWLDADQVAPTEAEIQAEIVRLQAEYDAKQYQRDRAVAYPSIQEQLDMQYWDSINGTTTWQDAISTVKSQYAKN
jgi:uncharacterized small protein (DUF1192 family)